ncbi:MAG: glycosyltransferase [Gammaproteobacteria bacterium]|nr:glycosyltransferase [Gammaproteobacteria bacterium]
MTAKKKIAFVLVSLTIGGAERVVVNLANYMADILKLDVTIIVFCLSEKSYIISSNVRVHNFNTRPYPYRLYEKPFVLFKRIRLLRRFFQKEKFDQIFSFLDTVNFSVILTGFPAVISSRASLNFSEKLYERFYFLYNRKNVKRIVALSNEMKKDFANRYIHNVDVIPNPFVPSHLIESDALKNSINKKVEKPYFLGVGRLVLDKNFPILIEAFSKTKCSENMLLLLAGEGNQRLQLQVLIEKLNFQNRVKLLGIQDESELDWLYRNAHATVMSSITEGFPNVLVESLSKGTPVISTDCPEGPRQIVRDKKNGFLVPVNDIFAMRDTLDLLVADKQLRQKLADYACESVAHLAIDKIADQWLNLP